MGGQIGFESVPNQGSTFWFTANLSLGTEASSAEPGPSVPEQGRTTGGTILVVEDNRVNQKVLSHQLTNLGYRVEIADNGAEAVVKVRNSRYDLILMDVQMPVMDGFQAAQEIRGMGGDPALIPIIAVTANAFPSERDRCLAIGMDDYLTKPVDKGRLEEAVRRWVKGSASQASRP